MPKGEVVEPHTTYEDRNAEGQHIETEDSRAAEYGIDKFDGLDCYCLEEHGFAEDVVDYYAVNLEELKALQVARVD